MRSTLSSLLELRILIGYLGEKAQHGWWNTSFLSPHSTQFLSFMAPNTVGLAQYHGALEAARRVHDEGVDVGSYHLFRLPFEMEQDLHRMVVGGKEKGLTLPVSKEEAEQRLLAWAEARQDRTPGPVRIGTLEDVAQGTAPSLLASTYLRGFQSGFRTFPYLSA